MQHLTTISDLATLPGPLALAIGVFDGVHLGHQEVIRAAMDYTEKHGGATVVMTFDPHPLKVLRPEAAPRLLCSTRHKLRILSDLGVTHTLVCPFDEDFARTDAAQFIESLTNACHPLGFISVGYTWSFGKGRGGNIHHLMELGQLHGFGVYGVPEVKVDGTVVSSTLVREAVRTGDFARARQLLGRDYTVLGEVVHGRHLGSQIGFPTANVAVENEELPPNGVYAVTVRWLGGGGITPPQTKLPGVANLGVRPTVESQGERSLEVHLLDFTGDCYGAQFEVDFVGKLRDEQKFDGLDALKAQIAKDVEAGREVLAGK
ncbi:MAG TPA: bifunctional riboflavin kinase/FAD synthetase [Candidatus Saccharimonadia bacterium]|nr:bifunctional riboflavin kinase/FAD synthetase [Candidatus Saccharimonadia bacterium]